jgi:hypothetical protein
MHAHGLGDLSEAAINIPQIDRRQWKSELLRKLKEAINTGVW